MNPIAIGTLILLLIVTIAIWWWPSLQIPSVTGDTPHALYMLSGIAQSLAAVFALAFALTLIGVQVLSRYTHRILGELFGAITIGYAFLFILSIIFPLWLLAIPNTLGAKFSLWLAALCLALLVPYFLRVRDKLNPAYILKRLESTAATKFTNLSDEVPGEVNDIQNIALQSLSQRDYGTFEGGVDSLAQLWLQARELPSPAADRLLERITAIGLVSSEDPTGPTRVVEALGRVLTTVVQRGIPDAVGDLAMMALRELANRAAELGHSAVVLEAARVLGKGASKLVERGLDREVMEVAIALGKVGSKAAQHSISTATEEVLRRLEAVGREVTSRRLARGATGVALALNEVGHDAVANGLAHPTAVVVEVIEDFLRAARDANLDEPARKAQIILDSVQSMAAERGMQIHRDRI